MKREPLILVDDFSSQFQGHGEKEAIVTDDTVYRYSDLCSWSQDNTRIFEAYGVHRGDIVAIDGHRHAGNILLSFLCLTHGLPFLLLNASWSPSRKEELMRSSGVRWVAKWASEKIDISLSSFSLAPFTTQNKETYSVSEEVVYLGTSSGTTGPIKCVEIKRPGFISLLKHQSEFFRLSPGQTVLQVSAPGLDAFIAEVFVSLWAGATLYPLACPDARLVPELIQRLKDKIFDLLSINPSMAEYIPSSLFQHLHTLVLMGESCRRSLIKRLLGKCLLVNAWAVRGHYMHAYAYHR